MATRTLLPALTLLLGAAPGLAQRVETIRLPTTQSMDGLYVDDAGTLYATGGYLGDKLYTVDPAERRIDTYATGFDGPIHLVRARSGVVYATDFSPQSATGSVSRVNAEGRAEHIATVPAGPSDIIEGLGGDLYVTQYGGLATGDGNAITRVRPDGAVSALATGGLLTAPVGIAMTEDGTVYAANIFDGRIVAVAPDGTQSLFASLPTDTDVSYLTIGHLAYADGVLYATHLSAHQVHAFDVETGVGRVLAGSGANGATDGPAAEARFSFPNGVAVSVTGDTVFVSEYNAAGTGRDRLRMIIAATSTVARAPILTAASVQIAPNPAAGDRIGVTAVLAKAAPVQLELVDVAGAVVARDTAPGQAGTNHLSLPAGGLAAGLYVARVTAGGASVSLQVAVE